MNRPIRFRAWDKATGRRFPVEFTIFGEVTCFDLVSQWLMEEPLGKDSLERMNDVEVEQFTGLTDKNGREIYEGDILHAPAMRKDAVAAVFWPTADDGFDNCWRIKTADGWVTGLVSLKDDEFACEVIGNIHENPELLKEPDHGT